MTCIVFANAFACFAQTEQEIEPELLIEALDQFESAYFGVLTQSSLKDHSWGMDKLSIWISNNGQIQVVESESTVERGNGKVERTVSGVYNTLDFSFGVSESYSDGTLDSRSLTAVPGYYPDNVGTQEHAVLFGYSQDDAQRFSALCRHQDSELDVTNFRFSDTDLIGLDCTLSGQGFYRFGFNRSKQLVYFEVRKQQGDFFIERCGVTVLGEPNARPNATLMDSLHRIWFPIVYREGMPQRAEIRKHVMEAGGKIYDHSASGFHTEILSFEKHSRSFDDRIAFDSIQLPDSIEVQPVRSGIPLRLVNGKLVSVVDGISIDEAKKVGFRRPGWWQRNFWYLWVILLLICFGLAVWVLRSRNTS